MAQIRYLVLQEPGTQRKGYEVLKCHKHGQESADVRRRTSHPYSGNIAKHNPMHSLEVNLKRAPAGKYALTIVQKRLDGAYQLSDDFSNKCDW